jgi:hypothetical protein
MLPVNLIWIVEGFWFHFGTEATVSIAGTVQSETEQTFGPKHSFNLTQSFGHSSPSRVVNDVPAEDEIAGFSWMRKSLYFTYSNCCGKLGLN